MSRNERERICLIVNPRSAGGATGRRINAIRDAAGRRFAHWEVRLTQRQGHATELAAAAAEEGFDIVAAVGGDGTCNEVVNGLFDGDRPRGRAVFTVVPAGTGSDLIKTLKIPKDLDEAMEVAANGQDRATDLMLVEVAHVETGEPVRRICMNVMGIGANGEVVAKANQSDKRWGGTLTFLGATLRTLAEYTPPPVEFTWTDAEDVERRWEGRLLAAFVGNGQYCGGGMWIGKGGSMQDGLADITLIPVLPATTIARHMHRIYSGTLHEAPGILRVAARTMAARPVGDTAVRVDVDGEGPGVLPGSMRVLAEVLVVRACW